MGMWKRTLVYLGLVEDDGYEDGFATEPDVDEGPKRTPLKRSHPPERRDRRRSPAVEHRDAVVRAMPQPAVASVYHLSPTDFNQHAQELGDRFRSGAVVIMNLKETEPEVAGRLKNFASGLVYGLEGVMRKVGDDVFLLSPRGIQVSAEEQQRYLAESGLFNEA